MRRRGCDRLPPLLAAPAGAICVAPAERIWCAASEPGRLGAFVSDIFREIDEELRRDNLLKLWSRYGKLRHRRGGRWSLLIVGGIVAWRDHQATERRAQSARYTAALALAREGKDAEAAKVFAAMAQEGGGYGVLAAFEQAELLAKSGRPQGRGRSV